VLSFKVIVDYLKPQAIPSKTTLLCNKKFDDKFRAWSKSLL